MGGTFVLRIEDTDRSRVTPEAIQVLIDSLRWLGMDWDEGPEVGGPHGPYKQSERSDIYAEMVDRFLADTVAYRCYCTPEELEARRKAALAEGGTPGYDGRCRTLTDAQRSDFETEGRPFAVRFAMPGRDILVRDIIRGAANFPASDLHDFVIVRSDGSPTYMLAATVDDHLMGMTHVIRGEDLFPSTPRQMMIFEALGAPPPRYAHLPLIVGSDRQPLSKRHGAVAVEWFRESGFLPEALVNYLGLLGWSFDEETTFFTLAEMVERFELERVSHNPAAFDMQKLEFMNGHYIRELPVDDVASRVGGQLAAAGVHADPAIVREAVPLIQERMKLLTESVDLLRFLFVDEVELDEKAAKLVVKAGPAQLAAAKAALEGAGEWTSAGIESVLAAYQEDSGLSKRDAWQPIRAAVTGSNVSPPLFESIALLGRERTLARMDAAIAAAAAEQAGDALA
jgi:glutamyl-tRNA synthetase